MFLKWHVLDYYSRLENYLVTLGEINFLIIVIFFLFFSVIVNINTTLHLLLTAEFIWIALYGLVILVGLLGDSDNLISLTFFFLVMSAVELGFGLVITLYQHLYLRSISLVTSSNNTPKFSVRYKNKLYINKFLFL